MNPAPLNPVAQTADEAPPLRLRRRPDLQAEPQSYRQQRQWVIKDPASLKYYQLSDEDYFLFNQLDGQTSLEQIIHRFEAQFAPRRLTPDRLHAFVGMLHREGLLLGDVPGQAEILLERKREQTQQQRRRKFAEILAIRFRGFDPQPLLNFLEPKVGWLFSRPMLAIGGLLILAAGLLVIFHLPEFIARKTELTQFLTGRNLFALAATVAGVKILHELGHALACRRLGGECHEIGPMLLLFTPCLYCNVSDAWMLPSKWQRAGVAAAGIYVELLLASIATFLWWFSEPGMFNSLCLNVILVCSVGTVLFNGNPLLRYDGYYVLADLTETPNLQEQASTALKQHLARWFFGINLANNAVLPHNSARQQFFLLSYGVASFAYRMFVMFAVLWLFHVVLKPYQLDILVLTLAVVMLIGLLLQPITRAIKFMRHPQQRERFSPLTLFVRSFLTVLGLSIVLAIPLPARVTSPAVIRLEGAKPIYVSVPGQIQKQAAEGEVVAAQDIILELKNDEVALALQKAAGECEVQRLHVENLRRQAVRLPAAADELPSAQALLADREKQLIERQAEQARLTIRAPQPGTVLPPPTQTKSVTPGQLPNWSGKPLEPKNLHATLETGTLVCSIGDPQQVEALLLVNQHDVQFVQVGQQVLLQTDLYPGQAFNGKIIELSASNTAELPAELVPRDASLYRINSEGKRELIGIWFLARVQLEKTPKLLSMGATADAQIQVASRSLGQRAWRWLSSTFRIHW